MTRGDRLAFGCLALSACAAGSLVLQGELVLGIVLGALVALVLVLMLIGGRG